MDSESEHISIARETWQVIEPGLIDESLITLTQQRARLWSLVLDARFLPCQIVTGKEPGGWSLLVPLWRSDEAYQELQRFERENRQWPPAVPPPRPLRENTLATISVLILLATFHNITRLDITGPGGITIDWLQLGSADASRILDGEWWRLVTALTLHSDVVHLLSNLFIGGMFVLLLCRELGSGLAWALLLLAGSLGNLINAAVQTGKHSSVGASTAVFGAVGILAALSLVRYRNHLRKRWMLPVAAALGILVLLGTEGKNTDLGAHLFGFLAGIALGLATESVIGRSGQPGRTMNLLLALLSGVTVVAAWLIGVTAG